MPRREVKSADLPRQEKDAVDLVTQLLVVQIYVCVGVGMESLGSKRERSKAMVAGLQPGTEMAAGKSQERRGSVLAIALEVVFWDARSFPEREF